MTRHELTAPGHDALWGFCEHCEGWILSRRWYDGDTHPRCPQCGSRPSAVERNIGETTLVTFDLELPPGTEEVLLG